MTSHDSFFPGDAVFSGRFIVVGVSGGIAAYKSVDVCRQLVDAGAHVAPIMTSDAENFIGKTTLSALCSEPVHTSLWDDASPIPHTRLGQRADVIVVAPATALNATSIINRRVLAPPSDGQLLTYDQALDGLVLGEAAEHGAEDAPHCVLG